MADDANRNTEDPNVQKVKVQPYPIAATFEGDISGTAKILRLVHFGLQMETAEAIKVHDKITIKWEMPVSYKALEAQARVVKIYNQLRGEDESGRVQRLVECHFLKPDIQRADIIRQFTAAIGQKQ